MSIKKLFFFIAVIFLSACTSIEAMYARYSYSFITLSSDKRIHYEEGAEDVAKLVKDNLDTSIEEIVNNEYVPFSKLSAINVYIFNNFQRYTTFSTKRAGRASSSENDIFISPKIKNNISILPGIITHELSHIHLRQYVGSWKYVYGIPPWFKEGLAVTTSNGAGAEGVSRKEAIKFIQQGRHFEPSDGVGLFNIKYSNDYGLKAHMFYRQAWLFVDYLKESNSPAFEKCYKGLISEEDFEDIWVKYYGKSIAKLWIDFKANIGT